MEIINKVVYQQVKDKKLTALFKRGVEDYLSFQKEFEAVKQGKCTYEEFVKLYGGYNRGLGYADFNYKSVTVTIYEETQELIENFEIWDDIENYEANIQDWI